MWLCSSCVLAAVHFYFTRPARFRARDGYCKCRDSHCSLHACPVLVIKSGPSRTHYPVPVMHLSRSSSTARALSRAGTFFNPFGPCFLSFFLYYFAQTSWRTNVASQKSQSRCLSVHDKCIGGLCVCALSHLQRPEQSERPAKHASTGASVA